MEHEPIAPRMPGHAAKTRTAPSPTQPAGRLARTLAAALLLTASGWAQAACPATERQLVGSWQVDGRAGFFEVFSIEIDAGERSFNSWRHERPDILDATWKFENCQLIVVTPPDEGFDPFRFKIIGLKAGKLRLYDLSDRTESVYKRIPE